MSRFRWLLWALLALPGLWWSVRLAGGQALAMDLYHPTGELSVRLMILALLPGPLAAYFGANRLLRGWLAIRRNLGVAAFAYAALHLAIYVIDMRTVAAMLDELTLPAIWTGWLAILCLTVPAAISFDRAVRGLGRRWQRLQLLVYPAFVLALLHWLLLGWAWLPAMIHLLPVAAAWSLRAAAGHRSYRRRTA